MNSIKKIKLEKPQTSDFTASLVVFLVALPLCMGIALASGVSPEKGLITGIIGGILVGLFAGCPLQVSGPAAGLVVVVIETVKQYGLSGLGLAVLGAGGLQLLSGFLGFCLLYTSPSPRD